jgi:hypothetical protein
MNKQSALDVWKNIATKQRLMVLLYKLGLKSIRVHDLILKVDLGPHAGRDYKKNLFEDYNDDDE